MAESCEQGRNPLTSTTPPPRKKPHTAAARYPTKKRGCYTINPYTHRSKNKIDIVLHKGGVPSTDAQPQISLLFGGKTLSIQWKTSAGHCTGLLMLHGVLRHHARVEEGRSHRHRRLLQGTSLNHQTGRGVHREPQGEDQPCPDEGDGAQQKKATHAIQLHVCLHVEGGAQPAQHHGAGLGRRHRRLRAYLEARRVRPALEKLGRSMVNTTEGVSSYSAH